MKKMIGLLLLSLHVTGLWLLLPFYIWQNFRPLDTGGYIAIGTLLFAFGAFTLPIQGWICQWMLGVDKLPDEIRHHWGLGIFETPGGILLFASLLVILPLLPPILFIRFAFTGEKLERIK